MTMAKLNYLDRFQFIWFLLIHTADTGIFSHEQYLDSSLRSDNPVTIWTGVYHIFAVIDAERYAATQPQPKK